MREACLSEAIAIIEEGGVEALSLREVARRLKISHQAPYKHFPSRDHILAEVVARAFADFAGHLDRREPGRDATDDLAEMGRAYQNYAASHPLQYRLMFGTPLPNPADHPAMMAEANHAFALLRDALARRAKEHGTRASKRDLDLDALFVWSCMHGFAGMQSLPIAEALRLDPADVAQAVPHAIARILMALHDPAVSRSPKRRTKT